MVNRGIDKEQTYQIFSIYLIFAIIITFIGIGGQLFYWSEIKHSIMAIDYVNQINENSTNTFGMYSDGDTIVIRDHVSYAKYYPDFGYTEIAFSSAPSYKFKISGDQTFMFGKMGVLELIVGSKEYHIGNQNITKEVIINQDDNGIIPSQYFYWSFSIDIVFYILIITGAISVIYISWKMQKYHLL